MFRVAMNYSFKEIERRHPSTLQVTKSVTCTHFLLLYHFKWSTEIGNILFAHTTLTCLPSLTAKIEHYIANTLMEDDVLVGLSPTQKWFGNEDRFPTHCINFSCHRHHVKFVSQALHSMKKDGLLPPKVEFLANQILTHEKVYRNSLIKNTTYTNKLQSIALRDVDKEELYDILSSDYNGDHLIRSLYNRGLAAVQPSFIEGKVHFIGENY